MISLSRLFQPKPERSAAEALYAWVAQAARAPRPFAEWGVPDTFDGRFDMLVLQAFFVLNRLQGQGERADATAQAFFDTLFKHLDHTLREIGVGDMGIGRRIQAMASAFYGRCDAYAGALADPAALEAALVRNVYRDAPGAAAGAPALAAYVRATISALADQPLDTVLDGAVRWDAP